jgi:glycerophosphoryl diester phosphodiesterase
LAGLRRAKALGCTWVEFDVRLTADGALVLLHDSRLDRTTDAAGRVASKPLSVVRRCDAGSRFDPAFYGEPVPTLEEALALAAELDLGANVEIKADAGRMRRTAAIVSATLTRREYRHQPMLVSSFSAKAVGILRDLAPRLPRGLLLRAVPRRWEIGAARLGCATLHVNHEALTQQSVDVMRAAGYPVLAYTVNDAARAQRLFEWGVASVFSDVPDIILSLGAGPTFWPMPIPADAAARQRGATP